MTLSTHSSTGSFSPRASAPSRRATFTAASLMAIAVAFTAAACGGSSGATGGHSSGGSAASVGQGGDDGTLNSGGTSASSSGAKGGSSGSSTGTGGSGAGGSTGTSGGSTSGGDTSSAGASDTTGGASTGGTGTSTGGSAGSTTLGTTQCNDGIDNDGDGFIDGFDPECTGPWDNDEGTFATGIPGDNKDPKWQDCFFDGNSGAGDDGCRYATDCLYGTMAQDDPSCTVTQACIDYCGARTPNGCDCFGCCTVQASDGSTVDIYEVSSCSLDNLSDTKACPRCTKNTQCENTCGECELCPGKTAADLPASCSPPPTTGTGGTSGSGGTGGSDTGGTGGTSGSSAMGGTGGSPPPPPPPPTYTCDSGEQVCGPDSPCPTGYYCQLGCCLVLVR